MIYDSLDKLPVVLYYRIIETNNLKLLIKKTTNISEEELQNLWDKLHLEFQELDNSFLLKKIFNLQKYYNIYLLKYHLINNYINLLSIEYNEEYISEINRACFKINKENYSDRLYKIRNEVEGLLIKTNHFKGQISKTDTTNNENISIEDILSIFSSVLGYHLGSYMKITCREYSSIKKQVNIKIKHQEKELQNLKNKQR